MSFTEEKSLEILIDPCSHFDFSANESQEPYTRQIRYSWRRPWGSYPEAPDTFTKAGLIQYSFSLLFLKSSLIPSLAWSSMHMPVRKGYCARNRTSMDPIFLVPSTPVVDMTSSRFFNSMGMVWCARCRTGSPYWVVFQVFVQIVENRQKMNAWGSQWF